MYTAPPMRQTTSYLAAPQVDPPRRRRPSQLTAAPPYVRISVVRSIAGQLEIFMGARWYATFAKDSDAVRHAQGLAEKPWHVLESLPDGVQVES